MKYIKLCFAALISVYYFILLGQGIVHAYKSDKFMVVVAFDIFVLLFIITIWKLGFQEFKNAFQKQLFLLLTTIAIAIPVYIIYIAAFKTGDFFNIVVLSSLILLMFYIVLFFKLFQRNT